MSRFWKHVLIVIAVVVVLAAGFRLWHQPARDGRHEHGRIHPADQAVPVTVVPVIKKNVPVYLNGLGTVVAYHTVTVSPRVSGQLLELHFREGGLVKKGELLARIDSRGFRAAYDQALATQRQAQAQLDTARSHYRRSRTLLAKGYISGQDLENLRNKVVQYQALLAADKALTERARVQLDYTRIVSPINGVAGLRQVDPGNIVAVGTAIVTLTRVHPVYVDFSLPEQHIGKVRAAFRRGMPVAVRVFDANVSVPITADGVLQVVNNQIDPNTGTFKLRAVFNNNEGNLWPGQFVNVRLKAGTVRDGLVIPAEAVQRGPNGDYVYVLQPDKTVKMQAVKVAGEVGDSQTMISKGVRPGQPVVTEGQFRLKPGIRVTPLKPGEKPAVATSGHPDNSALSGPDPHRHRP